MFENYETTYPESESVMEDIKKSAKQLNDVLLELQQVNIDEDNIFGEKAKSCFEGNVYLAKLVCILSYNFNCLE